MNAPRVRLLLTGRMGSGVSAAAHYLESLGASRWDRPELMCRLAHAIGPMQLGNPDELLERVFHEETDRDEVRLELLRYAARYEPEPGRPHRLYQDVTDICQRHDALCFEVELDERMQASGTGPFAVIDAVCSRDALEFFAGPERGYVTVRIACEEPVRLTPPARRGRRTARPGDPHAPV